MSERGSTMAEVRKLREAATVVRLVMGLALLALGPPARAQEAAKADWMAGMKTVLPTAFCAEGMYFRSCFRIDAQECERVAASATRICLDDLSSKIPATLKQSSGTEWGTKVGSCAGQAFEVALAKKKVKSPKCNDPSAWTSG
jgi:hypothetical protein